MERAVRVRTLDDDLIRATAAADQVTMSPGDAPQAPTTRRGRASARVAAGGGLLALFFAVGIAEALFAYDGFRELARFRETDPQLLREGAPALSAIVIALLIAVGQKSAGKHLRLAHTKDPQAAAEGRLPLVERDLPGAARYAIVLVIVVTGLGLWYGVQSARTTANNAAAARQQANQAAGARGAAAERLTQNTQPSASEPGVYFLVSASVFLLGIGVAYLLVDPLREARERQRRRDANTLAHRDRVRSELASEVGRARRPARGDRDHRGQRQAPDAPGGGAASAGRVPAARRRVSPSLRHLEPACGVAVARDARGRGGASCAGRPGADLGPDGARQACRRRRADRGAAGPQPRGAEEPARVSGPRQASGPRAGSGPRSPAGARRTRGRTGSGRAAHEPARARHAEPAPEPGAVTASGPAAAPDGRASQWQLLLEALNEMLRDPRLTLALKALAARVSAGARDLGAATVEAIRRIARAATRIRIPFPRRLLLALLALTLPLALLALLTSSSDDDRATRAAPDRPPAAAAGAGAGGGGLSLPGVAMPAVQILSAKVPPARVALVVDGRYDPPALRRELQALSAWLVANHSPGTRVTLIDAASGRASGPLRAADLAAARPLRPRPSTTAAIRSAFARDRGRRLLVTMGSTAAPPGAASTLRVQTRPGAGAGDPSVPLRRGKRSRVTIDDRRPNALAANVARALIAISGQRERR